VMGAARAGVYLQGQHLCLPPGQDLDLRDEPRADPVADQVGESLLLIQRVGHAAHIAAAILHPISRVPPAVLAKATIVFNAPSDEERSLLNSSVLPSGRLSRSSRSMLLGIILGSCQLSHCSEFPAECGAWVVSPTLQIRSGQKSWHCRYFMHPTSVSGCWAARVTECLRDQADLLHS